MAASVLGPHTPSNDLPKRMKHLLVDPARGPQFQPFTLVQNLLYNYCMKTYTVSEARQHFAEILSTVEQGEDVAITKHGTKVATITRPRVSKRQPAIPPPGFLEAEGWTVEMADDFDAIPEGFEDYV